MVILACCFSRLTSLLDNRVKDKLSSTGVLINTKTDITNRQILDCTSGESYEVNTSSDMNDFCNLLSNLGIKVFKKSSCVNAFILGQPNPANYIKSDPHGYCIKCGVCK